MDEKPAVRRNNIGGRLTPTAKLPEKRTSRPGGYISEPPTLQTSVMMRKVSAPIYLEPIKRIRAVNALP